MYTHPSQNPLPYDPSRVTQPMYEIDPNRPPYVPPYQCEPWLMQQFGAYCAGLLMQELQMNATQGKPLRIFTFNQYAQNGFRNGDFDDLFAATMDAVAAAAHTRDFGNVPPDEIIRQMVPEMVAMAAAANVQEFRALREWLDERQLYDIGQTLQTMQRVTAIRRQFRERNPVFGYGPVQQQQPAPGGYARPGGVMSQLSQALGGHQESNTPIHRGGAARTWTPVDDEDNPYARMKRESQPKRVTQTDDVLAQPFSPRNEEPMTPTNEMNQVPIEADGSFLVLEDLSRRTWAPSARQPYRPVYHPSHQVRMHRVYPDGSVVVEVHEKDPNMDYEKHNIASVFGRPREGADYDTARANSAFARGAQEFAERSSWVVQSQQLGDTEEGRAAAEKAAQDPNIIVSNEDEWLVALSEVEMMLACSQRQMKWVMEKGEVPDVFRICGFVSEPVICVADQSDFLRRAMDSRTYLELAEKLTAGVSESEIELVEAIIRRAIKLVNRVLALYLSIPPTDLSLGLDFDKPTILELESVLEEQYGPIVFNAYRANQRKHIASIFQTIDPAEEEQFRSDLVDFKDVPEDKRPWVALLTTRNTYSTLAVYAHDLDINFDADTGSLIQQEGSEMQKALYQVVMDLFVRLPKKPFYRHILKTIDGVLLEVVEGDIGDGAYLISRAPQVWYG